MCSRCIALIPAYEPEDILLEVVKELYQAEFDIFVVDDGSGPAYRSVFEKVSHMATVLDHPVNQGKGCAIKTGLSRIQSSCAPASVVVTVDADGQHSVRDALRVCEAARSKPDALILGSRALKQNVPLRSRFGNTATRLVYRLSTGVALHDTQTGLRAFSAAMIPKLLAIPGSRYEYEMNVLLEFARRRIPMQEIEIETIYLNRNSASHFDTVKDSVRVYKEILKFSASSLVSFLLDYGLYSLLSLLTAGLPAATGLRLSNIGARIVSASVNYTLNRRFVFKSSESLVKSVLQYVLLAVCILLGNTAVLSLFVNIFGMNRFLAKLITEVLFFILSWLVQRCVIFRRKEAARHDEEKTRR